MKIKVNVEKLRAAIAVANLGACRKPTMPILGMLLFEAYKAFSTLHLTGNTLDLSISIPLTAEVEGDCAFCISGVRFLSIVSAVEGEEATFDVSKTKIQFSCGRSKFTLLTVGAEEFPRPAPLDMRAAIIFEQLDLKTRFKAVEAAQCEDPTRFALNGTAFQRTKSNIHLIATDGRRMHAYTTKLDETGEISSITIPYTATTRLCSLLGDNGTVAMAFDQRKAEFVIAREGGDITFITKLVESQFPQWRNVIVPYEGSGLTVKREELSSAVRRVALATSEKNSSVRFTISDAAIRIFGASPENGEAEEFVNCENKEKMVGEVAANAVFVVDALESTDADVITFNLRAKDPSISPISITAPNLQTIIMPVRLQ